MSIMKAAGVDPRRLDLSAQTQILDADAVIRGSIKDAGICKGDDDDRCIGRNSMPICANSKKCRIRGRIAYIWQSSLKVACLRTDLDCRIGDDCLGKRAKGIGVELSLHRALAEDLLCLTGLIRWIAKWEQPWNRLKRPEVLAKCFCLMSGAANGDTVERR